MSKQKKITNQRGDFNGVSDITELESRFLPKADKGRKILDDGYDKIYEYELLEPIILDARERFKEKILSEIGQNDLDKINKGLADYVKSSRVATENLLTLKKSILNAFDEDILTSKYYYSDDATKQLIKDNYFEDIEEILKNDYPIISKDSIQKYKEIASIYTEKALIDFFKSSEQYDLNSEHIYRGLGNIGYEKNKFTDNIPDFLSVFTGVEEPIPYFENKILNSYSLNRRVAEKFMVSKNNRRKVFVEISFDSVIINVFSSFIVSEMFEYSQFEFLCLPNQNDLFISQTVNDSLCAEFYISGNSSRPNRMVRRNIDEEE